jgi:DNA polymerase-4
VARRLREKQLAGVTVTVKLKDAGFQLLTRSRRMTAPTQKAEAIFQAAAPLVRKEADGRSFRLIGVGVADLTPEADTEPPDLFAGAAL